jgi:hypothetical protein
MHVRQNLDFYSYFVNSMYEKNEKENGQMHPQSRIRKCFPFKHIVCLVSSNLWWVVKRGDNRLAAGRISNFIKTRKIEESYVLDKAAVKINWNG